MSATDVSNTPAESPDAPPGAPPRPRRKGRWFRRLGYFALGLVVLLLILVGLAPTIVSMRAVREPILASVNAGLAGSIAADDCSLSWWGPTTLRGLVVKDAEKREVIRIDDISMSGGLWGLIVGGLDFGALTIQNGRVVIQVTPDNSVSIAQAFAPARPAARPPSTGGGKLPALRGELVVRNVAVQVVQADGRSLEVSDVNASVNVQTLSAIDGQIGLTLKEGGKLSGAIDVRDLVSDGRLAPDRARGTAKFSTTEAIPVGPLARFAAQRDGLEGTARLEIDAKFEGTAVRAGVSADLARVIDRRIAGPEAAALDVGLKGDVAYAGDALTSKVEIASSAGTASADVRYALSSKTPPLDGQTLIDAVLNGKSIALPDFDVRAQAKIDLAAVERAVPGALKVKEGQKLTGGTLEVASLTARGGASPTAAGSVQVKDLAAEGGGKAIRVEPVACTFDAALAPGKGLEVKSIDLSASFARVQASGTPASLKADFGADLQKLRNELGQIIDLSGLALGGQISGKATLARVGDQRFDVDLDARGTQLTYADTRQSGGRTLAPIDVAVKGKGSYDNRKAAATADIATSAGAIKADGRYDLASAAPSLTTEQILAAVLSGGPMQLPEFDLKAQGAIDLAAVERAMPGLIRIKEGQTLSGGRLEIASLSARGGANPAASGSVKLSELASQGGGGSIRIDPISLTFDTLLQPGKGLEIKAAELLAGFARVQASGAAANLKATFDTSLTKLKQELGQIVDFGAFELAGQISGTLNVARASDERIDVTLDASGSQIRYSADGRRIEIPTLAVQQVGQLAIAKNQPQRFTSTRTALDLAGQLEAAATGYFDFNTKGYAADVDAKRVELAFLHAQLAGLGVGALQRYGGSLALTAKVAQESADKPLATNGTLTARALTVDGQPMMQRDATLTWTDTQFDTKTTSLRVAAAKLDSALANLAASDVRFASGDKLTLSGKVDATADVAETLRVVGRIAKMEKPPELAGRLNLSTTAAAEGDAITVAARGGVEQFVVGSGASAFKQDKVSFEADARMDQKAESVTLSQFKLASAPLTATMNGTIDQYRGPVRVALKGRYDSNWDQLTAIIHQFAPATVETVVIKGPTGSEFQITGPANDPAARPTFRGLASGLDVGWTESRLYGVQTGPAKLSPALKDGQLTLPLTSIAAADGKINLRGVVDFQPTEPTLNIAGGLTLLQNVSLNNRLAHDVLSWLNPIFLNILQIEGKAHLNVQDVLLPLGDSLKRSGAGRGRLDLKTVRMQPAGLIAELVRLGGMNDRDMTSVQFSAVDFVVKDGRVHYDNFTMVFPGEYDMKFRGSVGFDSTLDLVLSLPVRPALLDRLGVKGIPSQYANLLSKSRVELPLVGTRENPKLDFSKVDTKELMKGLIPAADSPAGAVDDLLKGLGGLKPGEKKGKPK